MSTSPAQKIGALTAVAFAMKVIHPEARTQRLHAGFLTARNINADTIAAHWSAIADRWPGVSNRK